MAQALRVLGFDFGTRQIGVAVGQSLTGSAEPLTVLRARDGIPDWDQIARLIDESYPNYEAVIPVDNDRKMVVNRDAMLAAVKRVGLYSSSMTNQIRLSIQANHVEVSAEDIERSSEARETVLCATRAVLATAAIVGRTCLLGGTQRHHPQPSDARPTSDAGQASNGQPPRANRNNGTNKLLWGPQVYA